MRTIGPPVKETAVERGPRPTTVVLRDHQCVLSAIIRDGRFPAKGEGMCFAKKPCEIRHLNGLSPPLVVVGRRHRSPTMLRH
jgi:hypothetical protein